MRTHAATTSLRLISASDSHTSAYRSASLRDRDDDDEEDPRRPEEVEVEQLSARSPRARQTSTRSSLLLAQPPTQSVTASLESSGDRVEEAGQGSRGGRGGRR